VTTEKDPEDSKTAATRSGASGKRKQAAGAAKSGTGKAKASPRATTKSKTDAAKPAGRSATRKRAPAATPPEPAAVEGTEAQRRPLPRLLTRFREQTVPTLVREFGYTSPMQVPRLDKIVLNVGLGEALQNARAIESATRDLTLIAGQQPVTTRARKSIASFKIREGMPIGIMVTLRGRRMYEFFDRLVSSSLPRIRDFRGISREAFDGRGNYALGLREQIIFPEIDYNTIDRIRGMQISIVTTAATDPEGLRLLELMGMPLVRAGTEAGAA
jgi:large subunit ribosomal protein L5